MTKIETTTTESAMLLAFHLTQGDSMTNKEAAELTGLSPNGAYKMLCRGSRVIPIYQDEAGIWPMGTLRRPKEQN